MHHCIRLINGVPDTSSEEFLKTTNRLWSVDFSAFYVVIYYSYSESLIFATLVIYYSDFECRHSSEHCKALENMKQQSTKSDKLIHHIKALIINLNFLYTQYYMLNIVLLNM